ncbi:SCO1664 family protein [Jiangella anatolica]|uniref:Phosphatidylinositol kinase n=1 Tax=Jiangella anatolica TaxID=2670374 RepID=A0A2W2CAX0_9ACTN|nr:SCO1664 family protein [Jiangella anatolica]PZF82936.1 phosphatidylinositol kinase [Jiangella anatolica]
MDLLSLLREGELTIEGRLVVASNLTLLGRVTHGDASARCVYKPVGGEQPLWDFPDGTLAAREAAAYEVSDAAGWHLVPPTVLREDGPFGAGMCQAWMDQGESDLGAGKVDVIPASAPVDRWLPILEAVDGDGSPVLLVHADDPGLRRLAVFDAVVNNADRKGGHVLVGDRAVAPSVADVVGVDHGVCFNVDPKLRTVLWGWAGSALTADERSELTRLRALVDGPLGATLSTLLAEEEVAATAERIDALLARGTMPSPEGRMPVPWPVF